MLLMTPSTGESMTEQPIPKEETGGYVYLIRSSRISHTVTHHLTTHIHLHLIHQAILFFNPSVRTSIASKPIKTMPAVDSVSHDYTHHPRHRANMLLATCFRRPPFTASLQRGNDESYSELTLDRPDTIYCTLPAATLQSIRSSLSLT